MDRQPHLQYRSAEEIQAFQQQKLRETIAYVAQHSRFYQRLFAQHNIDPSSIQTLDDLRRIPPTTKLDLQQYNDDFFCVSKRDIIDYVTTSGTLGRPVTVGLTRGDLDRLSYNEYLSFTTAGCTPDDILQLILTLDRRFMAGMAYYMGACELGMGVSRVGNGAMELQWDTINRIGTTCGMVIPSFLMKMIDYAEKHGIDYRNSTFRKCVCIGEALRDADGNYTDLGAAINKRWPELQMYTTYASTEMQSSFTDCQHFSGGHLQPELIIVEFLDEDNNPVPEGQAGEVTITTIGIECMPLVRFKTGDLCKHFTQPCPCGRHTMRLGPVVGRRAQMLKYKGTTIYPPALFDVLNNAPGVINYVVEAYTNELGTDEITVRVGAERTDDDFKKTLKDLFRAKTRVAPEIRFESPEYIRKVQWPDGNRKPVLFIDLR